MMQSAVVFAAIGMAAAAFGYFSAASIFGVLFLLFLTLALAKPKQT